MENKINSDSITYSGTVPMVQIDGAKVRRLREEKKLTQLYLSTVVGVTTDTISRWENKHYQSIKLENAEKLAQALEVSFEEILKKEEPQEPDAEATVIPVTSETKQDTKPSGSKSILAVAILITVLLSGLVVYKRLSQPVPQFVSATRILPPHVAPGQTFPVLILVQSTRQEPVSLIIKEIIPPGTSSTEGLPGITNIDRRDNSLKWIQRLDSDKAVYAYLCNLPRSSEGNNLVFDGTVTLKQNVKGKQDIEGDKSLRVALYHWADLNQDYMIDDEEILAVYDTYSDIEELSFDRELIDSIWASSGYEWDAEQENFVTKD